MDWPPGLRPIPSPEELGLDFIVASKYEYLLLLRDEGEV